MKLIQDIRLFESETPNADGNPHPEQIGRLFQYDDMACLDTLQRLLFLLRHRGFSFRDFDHLYVNFTSCVPHGEVRDVNRYNIREFSWYQYVDTGCDPALFNHWCPKEKTDFILESIRKAALLKAPEDLRSLFDATFREVLQKGEKLLIPYKQKETDGHLAEILTRITDDLDFMPLIRVTDKDGSILAEQELRGYGRDEFISQIGTITIGKHSLRIAPRKNWYADFYSLEPVRIRW